MPPTRGKSSPPSLAKRLFLTVALCAVLALVGRSLIGDRGFLEVLRKKSSFQRLSAEVRQLRQENAALTEQIQALRSDPLAIERIAREELGYARPGEITFVLREDQATRAVTNP